MKNGIDVSYAQGYINWAKVKTDFVIMRIGYGRLTSQTDVQFANNYLGCQKYGIPKGGYWYAYATTPADAINEAKACLAIIKGKKFEYPIYYDIEESKILNTGKENVTAIAKAFCSTLEKAGYFVGIYSTRSALENHFTDDIKKRYAVWLANVADGNGNPLNSTGYKGSYGMWQYSWVGKVNGINGNVDSDRGYIDYPSTIKSKGLNGYKKATATPKQKTIEQRVTDLENRVAKLEKK